ncbi:MAG: geranylgeranylglycerol-phosphate geranylgeranyltransferase [Nitrososphaerota archaeon]
MLRSKSQEHMNVLGKAWLYLSMSRPPNGLLMFLAVVVGSYVASRSLPQLLELSLSFITAYCLNGSSMVINDIIDKEVDKINDPLRPIPSGRISVKAAIIYGGFLGLAGLFASCITGIGTLIVAIIFYAIANAYNVWLKPLGIIGNVAVSLAVVAPFLYGSVLMLGTISMKVLILGLLAFLANMGREVIKGMVDIEGDALRGVASIARIYGSRKAAVIGAGFILTAVILSPLPTFLGMLGWTYLLLVCFADIGFVYSAIKILLNPTHVKARKVKRELLAWMSIALIAFIIGA